MRFLMVGLAVLGSAGVLFWGAGPSVSGQEPAAPQVWTLEGELKVHPKYLYRHYIAFGNGQTCALYGPELRQGVDALAQLGAGTQVRVRGTLGTRYHNGGTKDNLSPFPPGWVLYMQVRDVEKLEKPQ